MTAHVVVVVLWWKMVQFGHSWMQKNEQKVVAPPLFWPMPRNDQAPECDSDGPGAVSVCPLGSGLTESFRNQLLAPRRNRMNGPGGSSVILRSSIRGPGSTCWQNDPKPQMYYTSGNKTVILISRHKRTLGIGIQGIQVSFQL
ncbi:hypothetical protein V8F06_008519 [Rhypophila decipiens]